MLLLMASIKGDEAVASSTERVPEALRPEIRVWILRKVPPCALVNGLLRIEFRLGGKRTRQVAVQLVAYCEEPFTRVVSVTHFIRAEVILVMEHLPVELQTGRLRLLKHPFQRFVGKQPGR